MIPIVAVDAMGGDYAPDAVVAGAVKAVRESRGALNVILVGREDVLRASVYAHGGSPDGLRIVHAPESISMTEHVSSLRHRKNTSLAVALELQKCGDAHATVSAGNTAAAMGLSLLTFGRLAGVHRPAIATTLPTVTGAATLLDAGANSTCKPENLLQFAVMGSIYHREVFGVAAPSVGLVSIGEESGKGDPLVVAAHELLAESDLNFVGNVEGKDIFPGAADVVVCDGFTGNVLLKFAESMPRFFATSYKREVEASLIGRIGALLSRGVFKRLRNRLDWQEFGGAPLLGIDGITIICHGRSEAKAIANAVRVAGRAVSRDLNTHIRAELEKVHVETAS